MREREGSLWASHPISNLLCYTELREAQWRKLRYVRDQIANIANIAINLLCYTAEERSTILEKSSIQCSLSYTEEKHTGEKFNILEIKLPIRIYWVVG